MDRPRTRKYHYICATTLCANDEPSEEAVGNEKRSDKTTELESTTGAEASVANETSNLFPGSEKRTRSGRRVAFSKDDYFHY